jgi:hypothetical protein
MSVSTIKNYRWIIVTLLFFANTINYIDRQIIGLLKPVLEVEISWTEIKDNEVLDGENMLSIYVGFNFSKQFLKFLFPAFMHDVLWYYSLCQRKDVIE